MMSVAKVILLSWITLNVSVIAHGKSWHGIAPLQSTRADVERLLGAPKDDLEGILVTYTLPDEIVNIQYAANPKCQEKWPYDTWDVAKRTVTFISVRPNREVRFGELNLDLSKFKKEPGDHDVPEHCSYFDEEQGFSVFVYERKEASQSLVDFFVYGPASKDNVLRCKPKGGWRVAPPTISFSET
jgi:hypothetical protein